MATEELDVFDVLLPEPETCHTHEPPPPPSWWPVPVRSAQASDAPAAPARSRPVDVPGCPPGAGTGTGHWPRDDSGGDHGDGGGIGNGNAIVPPHLLLTAGRRRSEEAEPAAWTLRRCGRPSSGRASATCAHLGDSVLRMTGFIEG